MGTSDWVNSETVLKNKRNHTRRSAMATARGPNWFHHNTTTDTHTEHAHTHRHTQQTCGNRESVVPAAWSRVVASAATMINWLREAGLCCGGFIFLDEEEEEEEERGEGCLGGFSWQGVRVTEQGGSE